MSGKLVSVYLLHVDVVLEAVEDEGVVDLFLVGPGVHPFKEPDPVPAKFSLFFFLSPNLVRFNIMRI